jgi:hypothetical protein
MPLPHAASSWRAPARSTLDLLYAHVGSCTENCQGDMNGDGVVNIDDTLALIGVFGMCPR